MIYHHLFTTPFGTAAIVFQKKPFLVTRIILPHPNKRIVQTQIKAAGSRNRACPGAVLALCRDIQASFEGAAIRAPWQLLDLSGLTPLQREVLEAVERIPQGEVRSYGEIAAQIGRPGACRFVGTTLAKNPFPICIPCHRVIRSDGSPGRFGGGTQLKEQLLALEQKKK